MYLIFYVLNFKLPLLIRESRPSDRLLQKQNRRQGNEPVGVSSRNAIYEQKSRGYHGWL